MAVGRLGWMIAGEKIEDEIAWKTFLRYWKN